MAVKPLYITQGHLAARWDTTTWTIARWVKAGTIPLPDQHLPGHPKFRLVEIEAFERGGEKPSRQFFRGHRKTA